MKAWKLVSLVLALVGLPAVVQAQFTFTITNGAVTITGYTGTNGDAIIPDTTNGLPVTAIGNFAFSGSPWSGSSLTNVTIGTNVTSIGLQAFGWCTGLTNITIPNSVTNIGASAFNYCGSLTNVTIGTNVASIGNGAFADCSSLVSMMIPSSVNNLGSGVFVECWGLTSIEVDAQNAFYSSANGFLFDKRQTSLIEAIGSIVGSCPIIPDSVTNIGAYAFAFCTDLASIAIPNSVTSIGDWAFYSCGSLTNVSVGTNVVSIGFEAFAGCAGLTSVTIPDSVTSIENNAFANCGGLTNVVIGTNVASIGWEAFALCTNLAGISIPNSVTSIGGGAFYDCGSLTNITIPGSVTNIGGEPELLEGMFVGREFFFVPGQVEIAARCGNLTSFTVDGQNQYYSSLNGILCNKNQDTILEALPGGVVGNFAIPNGVTNIGAAAFAYCTNLTDVLIPNSVTSIGGGAFYSCGSLTNVMMGTNVASIGEVAFGSCTNLTGITVPGSVASIGNEPFADCWSLASITVDEQNPFYSSLNGVLFNKQQTTIVEAPGAITGNYTVPESVTNIGYGAFEGCASLTSVTVGPNVASIGTNAFAFCYELNSVYFKGNAPSVDSTAFEGIDLWSSLGNTFFLAPVIYYLPGSQGWSTNFDGRTTVLWNPQAETDGPSFGVRTNRFGFNIIGTSNLVVAVEACTNLLSPVWQPVRTNTLTGGAAYFSDPQWTNYPGRFYRIRSP